MVHTGYIYNRLYDEGAQGVPYNLWTGKGANITRIWIESFSEMQWHSSHKLGPTSL